MKTLTTIEGLDALPEGAVILVEGHAAQKEGGVLYFASDAGSWTPRDYWALEALPAVLIYVPEQETA